MATQPDFEGAVIIADEANFNDTTVVVYDERLEVINSVTAECIPGLTQEKLSADILVNFMNDGRLGALGPYGGSVPLEVYLTGLGSTGAGALPAATELGTFLGRWFGTLHRTNAGTTVGAVVDAATFALVGGTVADGSMIRVGELDDGRGGGLWYPVNVGATCSLHVGCPVQPSPGDVVSVGEIIHPNEDSTGPDVVSQRLNLQTPNLRVGCWGCYPTTCQLLGMNPGELPRFRGDMGISTWKAENASTYPTDVVGENFVPAICAGGNTHINVVGTTTSALYTPRNIEITIDHQVLPLTGQGADNAQSITTGARRVKSMMRIAMDLDAPASGTTTWADRWADTTVATAYYHVMHTLSVSDGSNVGIWAPKCRIVDARPTQMSGDGLTRERVVFEALTESQTLTPTVLEQSSWRLALG